LTREGKKQNRVGVGEFPPEQEEDRNKKKDWGGKETKTPETIQVLASTMGRKENGKKNRGEE